MTPAHFYQFLVEQGFPIASLLHQQDLEKMFDVISQETTFLDRNFTTGHWFVKPGLLKQVRYLLYSERLRWALLAGACTKNDC